MKANNPNANNVGWGKLKAEVPLALSTSSFPVYLEVFQKKQFFMSACRNVSARGYVCTLIN